MSIVLQNGDIVKVVNRQPGRPLTIGYDGRKWKLEPEKPVLIPFEAAALWFGDPRASENVYNLRNGDLVTMIPDRESERRRLAVKYGDPGDGSGAYPKVDIYAIDADGNDQLIISVLGDPEGENILPAAPPTVSESNAAQRELEEMKSKLARIESLLVSAQGKPAVGPSNQEDDDIPTDGPPQDESNKGSSSKGPKDKDGEEPNPAASTPSPKVTRQAGDKSN